MMLKNFNGDVLKLYGYNLQTRSETAGVFVYNIMIPVSELHATALFPITNADIEFFKPGIAKVRLSTVPITHEKSFSIDVIGTHLYKALLKSEATIESF
jgi:hypothetical protein